MVTLGSAILYLSPHNIGDTKLAELSNHPGTLEGSHIISPEIVKYASHSVVPVAQFNIGNPGNISIRAVQKEPVLLVKDPAPPVIKSFPVG